MAQLSKSLSAAANLILSPSETPECVSRLDALSLSDFADGIAPDSAWDTLLTLARQLKLTRALVKILRQQASDASITADAAMVLMASICQETLGPVAGLQVQPESVPIARGDRGDRGAHDNGWNQEPAHSSQVTASSPQLLPPPQQQQQPPPRFVAAPPSVQAPPQETEEAALAREAEEEAARQLEMERAEGVGRALPQPPLDPRARIDAEAARALSLLQNEQGGLRLVGADIVRLMTRFGNEPVLCARGCALLCRLCQQGRLDRVEKKLQSSAGGQRAGRGSDGPRGGDPDSGYGSDALGTLEGGRHTTETTTTATDAGGAGELEQALFPDSHPGIAAVLNAMRLHPSHAKVQVRGLSALAAFAKAHDEHIVRIAADGGVMVVLGAMMLLPNSAEAQIAGVGILGHPVVSEQRVLRVTAGSRKLVLAAMRRFPDNEQLQGLGCLALANLAYKNDQNLLQIAEEGGLRVIVRALRTFSDNAKVQSAGCWAVCAFASKDERVRQLAVEAGAKDVCLVCYQQFGTQPRVRDNAQKALRALDRAARDAALDGHDGPQLNGHGSSSGAGVVNPDVDEEAPWERHRRLAGGDGDDSRDDEECVIQ